MLLELKKSNTDIYKKIKTLFIFYNNKLNTYKIEIIRIHKESGIKNKGFIKEGFDADLIINCDVFLPLSHLPILTGNKFYYHEVINFLIVDEIFGELGKISNIKENNSQDLFVINNTKGEVLIPIHDEFIIKVDRVKSEILVKTPDGLIDLYINS